MDQIRVVLDERSNEIDMYLSLLHSIEVQVRNGPPQLGPAGPIISTSQLRILYATVYLQLYNLVEATISHCIDSVSNATSGQSWRPQQLSDLMRKEWVRHTARTHTDLNYENRLEGALLLLHHLADSLPMSRWTIEKGGGGNWDDLLIEDFSTRLGCPLEISPEVKGSVKRHFRNDKGPLVFVKSVRNDLAHGRLSFVECGEGVTVSDLSDLRDKVFYYLEQVVSSFQNFIDQHLFLQPNSRPRHPASPGTPE